MKRLFTVFFLSCLLFLTLTKNAEAKIGVGVNTGKIQVDELLKSGMIYTLPSITVINTGDEAATYQVGLAYHENQPELRPQEGWFEFSPQNFDLEPGKAQLVNIKINLPLKTIPGNYFAYLEAYPKKDAAIGGTSIGIAAASKLYFTIVQSSYLYAIYYKLLGIWNMFYPWSERIAYALGVIIFILLFKKFFNLQINFKKPTKENDKK